MINKIKKILLSFVKSIKNFVTKGKHRINWHSIKKNKKKWAIGLFMLGYVIFWLWYFGERNVGLNEQLIAGEKKIDNKQLEDESNKDADSIEKKFTDADLGNFWLEINTDKIKVKAPVVDGVTDDKLNQGLGRHKTTALPGEKGNMVISGHRWKFGDNPAYKVFSNLDKLKKGDKVTVHYNNHLFEYEIIDSGVVRNNPKGAREVLKKTNNKMLTLYTCTPKHTSLRRLYYRAKFISQKKEK